MKKLTVALVLALAVTLASTAYAQGPISQGSDPFWEASYFNNVTLSGDPVTHSSDANIDWSWGSERPQAGVDADRFSVRWTRYIDLDAAGNYRFTATADDGIRVYVDGRIIIDEWYDHSAATFVADASLTEGHHMIVVEYYENGGDAVARVSYAPVSDTINNWRGEYFSNRWLSGSPTLVRDDSNIDFNWNTGSPASGIPSDGFSARWTRSIDFGAGGMYRFTTTGDDGVRLWVNDHLLIDKWFDQPATSYSDSIYISGVVSLKMEYYENSGLASAGLTWTRIGGTVPPPSPSGTVIVDDTDEGFVTGGAPAGWRTAEEGYDGHLTWTRNNDYPRYRYNWARWHPNLTPGRYEVFVYIPYRYTTTSNARYWVSHRDGYTLRVVNQSANDDRWVSLGTYWFRGTSAEYVSLADVTYESFRSQLIAFDAVKWEPR